MKHAFAIVLFSTRLAAAQAPCTPAQADAITAVLRAAPEQPAPETPRIDPSLPRPEATQERRCGPREAREAQRLFACTPTPEQAVLYMGVGRCLQQAGQGTQAAAAYRAYLMAEDAASEDRREDRRARVRAWLAELDEPPVATAQVIFESNLRGPLARELAGHPDGLVLDAGETRVPQPPGPRTVRVLAPGFAPRAVPLDLPDRGEARVKLDFRELLLPQHRALLGRWDDFAQSGLTPEGYEARRRRPLGVALGLLLTAGGGAVIGICAAGVGGACDAGWKQGLAYTAGGLFVVSGLISTLGTLLAPPQAMPQPGPAPKPKTPARPFL